MKNRIRKKWAKKCQRMVFFLERKKYEVIRRTIPDFQNIYENLLLKRRDRLLKKANSSFERKMINDRYKIQLLNFRREYNTKKNLNYHLDKDNLNETLKWLNWNKMVHVKESKKNIVTIIISLILKFLFFNGSILFSIVDFVIFINFLKLFINENCVFLQKYNIERIENYLKNISHASKKRQYDKISDKARAYGNATSVIVKSMNDCESLPTVQDIIDNITTKEQALELLKLLKMESEKENNNVYVLNKKK